MSETIRTTVRLTKAAHDYLMKESNDGNDMNERVERLVQAQRTLGPLVTRLEARIAKLEPLVEKGFRAMTAFMLLANAPGTNSALVERLFDLIVNGSVVIEGNNVIVNAPGAKE